jgi:uncharacterized membrane protein YfcA
MVNVIWIILVLLSIWFIYVFGKDIIENKNNLEKVSWIKTGFIGFIVNFFDVLGIGAFAPQTALLKFTKQTSDKLIPGTMNVANTLPVLIQAIIFIQVVQVETTTLMVMFLTAMSGAILGADIMGKLSERNIRLTISVALLITAGFIFANKMHWIKGEGVAIGIYGWKLVIAGLVNFILGAMMTAGVGLYAPCMALVYLLGLSPQVAFPIMMGSCAFLMPPASFKFIKSGNYNKKAALGMAIPSIIIIYTSVTMFLAAIKNK